MMPYKGTLLFLLCFLCIFSIKLDAQSRRIENKILQEDIHGPSPAANKKAADAALLNKDYYSALKFYERALAADTTQELLTSYAKSAEGLHAYDRSEAAYRAILLKYPASIETLISLGNSLFSQGRYDEAMAVYSRYLTASGDKSPAQMESVEQAIEKCTWAKNTSAGTELEIEINPLGEAVNTTFSESSPFIFKDKLYFSSYQFPFPTDRNNPKRQLVKIQSFQEKSGGNAEVLLEDFNSSNRHTAHVTFSSSGNAMYYTQCDFVESTSEVRCALFVSYRESNGKYGSAVKLPESVNMTGYNTTAPNVGFDEKTKQEVLYFASDRPNGKGGLDLYYSLILENGNFSPAVAIEELNTAGDEIAPFYHNKKQVLFFSSNGRNEKLGGYDIYQTIGKGKSWSSPVMLPNPLNTQYNDLYYIENETGTEAYFSSNRPGAQYLDTIGCCFDIFKANLVQPEMVAVSFDLTSMDSLAMTEMYLYEISGTNEEMKQLVTGFSTKFPLRPGMQYLLVGKKDGYSTDSIRFDTDKWQGLMVKELRLKPEKIRLIANAIDGNTKIDLTGVTCTFIDLGLVTAAGTLATAKDMRESTKVDMNPTDNTYTYLLDFNHRYKVIMKRDGYTMDSVEISTEGMLKSGVIEKDLYLRRGLNLEALAYDARSQSALLGTSIVFEEISGGRNEKGTNLTGNSYFYGIERGKRYRITISKQGYTTEFVEFSSDELNSTEAFLTLTKKLYLAPNDLAGYLPLKVYFDNDEPDKRTTKTTTNKRYQETYDRYYAQKGVFSSEFTRGSTVLEQSLAAKDIEDFFEVDVRGGWEKLQAFSKALEGILKSGNDANIIIQGYASPRSTSEYNKFLTSRRIESLRNHFKNYNGGVLRPYLDGGKLKITEQPLGSSKADPGVPSKFEDRPGSIFSVPASRERRVEIIEIR